MKKVFLLLVILFCVTMSAKAQHMIAFPTYVFAQSVLDTTDVEQPLLMMFYTARDASEMRVFIFSYPQGVYMGEALVLPNGRREFYPFEYQEERKPNEKMEKKKAKGNKTFIG